MLFSLDSLLFPLVSVHLLKQINEALRYGIRTAFAIPLALGWRTERIEDVLKSTD